MTWANAASCLRPRSTSRPEPSALDPTKFSHPHDASTYRPQGCTPGLVPMQQARRELKQTTIVNIVKNNGIPSSPPWLKAKRSRFRDRRRDRVVWRHLARNKKPGAVSRPGANRQFQFHESTDLHGCVKLYSQTRRRAGVPPVRRIPTESRRHLGRTFTDPVCPQEVMLAVGHPDRRRSRSCRLGKPWHDGCGAL
jgi:hypothetical protein